MDSEKVRSRLHCLRVREKLLPTLLLQHSLALSQNLSSPPKPSVCSTISPGAPASAWFLSSAPSSVSRDMNLAVAKPEVKASRYMCGGSVSATLPRDGPPKFKQRSTRQFKSKPPKRGVLGFGNDIPGMEGLGMDIMVICPWEAYSHLELHELAQYGII